MSEYAKTVAQRDAEQARLARDMSNATAQEREKYNAADLPPPSGPIGLLVH
ncbi:MAG: hypothetical protein JHD35_26170 [Sphingopyxis sp.]|nr:hypothetical protein [Sphingopyxis sp.]